MEERPLAGVHGPVYVACSERFGGQRGGDLALLLVEGAEDVGAEAQDAAILNQRQHELLPDVAVGQSGDRGHGSHCAGDLGRRDHDARACPRQSELGEAQGQNEVRSPERFGGDEDHAGERGSVGVVEDQRDAVRFGE